jgi:ketosteroid isomerase-like protein
MATVRVALEADSGFLSIFDEGAEMHAPDWGLDTEGFRGKTAIRNWLRNWMGTWDAYDVENSEYLDAGTHVVVEQLLRGRNKETGLPLNARHWSVFTLTRGKVVLWRFYRTRDEALRATEQRY